MISSALNLLLWILKLFGIGSSKSDVQAAQGQGQAQGKAEEQVAEQGAVLKEVEDAKQVRDTVRADAERKPGGLRQPDEFSRD